MGANTFSGGACEVVIYKDGEEINAGKFPPLFNSIASVRAEVGGGETSVVTIQLTPSFLDAIRILESGLLGTSSSSAGQALDGSKTPGAAVAPVVTSSTKPTTAVSNGTYYAVRFFYIGGESTPWYGGFAGVPGLHLSASGIEITIKVTGVHNLMSLAHGPNRFENQPALDVLNTLATRFGIEITFDEDDDETEKLLTDTKITGSYNEDYDNTIRRILTDLRCVVAKYDGDADDPKPQYRVKSSSYLTKQDIEYHFVMWRQVVPESNVIPLEELDLEQPGAIFAPGAVFGTFSRAVLSGTKEVKTEASDPTQFKKQSTSGTQSDGGAFPVDSGAGSAKGGATGLKDTSASVAGMDVHALERKDASTLGRAAAHSELKSLGLMVFHATGPGVPGLRPLSMIQLTIGPGERGIEAFSGPGHCQKLAHTWDTRNWTTESWIQKSGGPVFNPQANEKAGSAPKVATPGKVAVKATPL